VAATIRRAVIAAAAVIGATVIAVADNE